jgi:hypothetical protein
MSDVLPRWITVVDEYRKATAWQAIEPDECICCLCGQSKRVGMEEPVKDDVWALTARVEEALAAIPDAEERVRSAFFLMNAISSRNWWKPVEGA